MHVHVHGHVHVHVHVHVLVYVHSIVLMKFETKLQLCGHTEYLMESLRDSMSRPFGYLLIDCHQLTPDHRGHNH